jgi:DNA topoisomerase-1
VPTYTAFAVTELLERNFTSLVDTRFTAAMEEELDEIAEGGAEWVPYLRRFYAGPDGIEQKVKQGEEAIDPREASTVHLQDLPARVRIGKFGPYVEMQQDGVTVTASLPDGIPPADLTSERVLELLRAKSEGPDVLGNDPQTGKPVLMLQGRFGPYVQLGEAEEGGPKPKRASLPKGVSTSDVTLDQALRLLSLPRTLGVHPESGKEIQASIGRFGPFVVHEGDFRSLQKTDDVYTVDLRRALELLSQPKAGSRAKAEPLRTIGAHPGDGEPILLFPGRYGPYVKHGDTNASLPKGGDPEKLTLAEAVALLAERAAAGPPKAKKGRAGARKSASTSRAPAKSAKAADTGAKKSAAKKTTAKKSTAKKASRSTGSATAERAAGATRKK